MALIYHIIYLFTILLNIVLAGNSLTYKYKTRAVWMFFGFLVTLIGWATTLYLFYTITHPEAVYILGKMNFVTVTIMMWFLLVFTYEFPGRLFHVKKRYFLLLLLETVILSFITLFTPLVDQAEIIDGLNRITEFGPLYGWFMVHFLLYFIISLSLLIQKFRKYRGLEKLQITYILIGLSLSFVFTSITNMFIPFFSNNFESQNLGSVSSVILNLSFFYAVMKHRFFDIKLFAKRALVKLLSIAITLTIFIVVLISFMALGENNLTSQLILVALAFMAQHPIEKIVTNLFDKYSSLQLYNTERTIAQVLKQLPFLIDVDSIVKFLMTIMHKNMGLDKIAIILFDDNPKSKSLPGFHVVGKRGFDKSYKPLVHKVDFFSYIMNHQKILIADELKYFVEADVYKSRAKNNQLTKLYTALNSKQIGIFLPLVIKGKLLGVIEVGNKKTGDAFTQEDIDLLNSIASQSAIALENAILYDYMKDFNKLLQERVVEATGKLRTANKKLRELDRAKSEFVSIVSHQLRAPLTATSGYVSMLLDGDLGKLNVKLKKVIQKISTVSNRSKLMIEDLLSLSRLQSGKLVYNFEDISFTNIIQNIVDDFRFVAVDKGLEVSLENKVGDVIINADLNKIRQVVLNLIDNAVKYTSEGSVRIRISKIDDFVLLQVFDSGVGIDSDDAKQLFKKFRRSHNVTGIKGTGLGLYIARQFVIAHKGKIWASSDGEGKGSCFSVQLRFVK